MNSTKNMFVCNNHYSLLLFGIVSMIGFIQAEDVTESTVYSCGFNPAIHISCPDGMVISSIDAYVYYAVDVRIPSCFSPFRNCGKCQEYYCGTMTSHDRECIGETSCNTTVAGMTFNVSSACYGVRTNTGSLVYNCIVPVPNPFPTVLVVCVSLLVVGAMIVGIVLAKIYHRKSKRARLDKSATGFVPSYQHQESVLSVSSTMYSYPTDVQRDYLEILPSDPTYQNQRPGEAPGVYYNEACDIQDITLHGDQTVAHKSVTDSAGFSENAVDNIEYLTPGGETPNTRNKVTRPTTAPPLPPPVSQKAAAKLPINTTGNQHQATPLPRVPKGGIAMVAPNNNQHPASLLEILEKRKALTSKSTICSISPEMNRKNTLAVEEGESDVVDEGNYCVLGPFVDTGIDENKDYCELQIPATTSADNIHNKSTAAEKPAVKPKPVQTREAFPAGDAGSKNDYDGYEVLDLGKAATGRPVAEIKPFVKEDKNVPLYIN